LSYLFCTYCLSAASSECVLNGHCLLDDTLGHANSMTPIRTGLKSTAGSFRAVITRLCACFVCNRSTSMHGSTIVVQKAQLQRRTLLHVSVWCMLATVSCQRSSFLICVALSMECSVAYIFLQLAFISPCDWRHVVKHVYSKCALALALQCSTHQQRLLVGLLAVW
jgi:hypothetical protein